MHAAHAEMKVIAVRHSALSHEGCHDRYLRFPDELPQRIGRPRQNDTAADEQQGPFTLLDSADSPVDVISLSGRFQPVPWQRHPFRIDEIDFFLQGIFSNVDQNRTRPACRSYIKSFFQDAGNLPAILDEVIVFGNG